MAKTYRLGTARRLANRVFQWMTSHGIGARYRYLLTVPGRKSGLARSTPVDVMEIDGTRWLVAAYGIVGWVHNARVAGSVTLARGHWSERFRAEEVTGAEALPVLRTYIRRVRVTRAYFDAGPDAGDEALLTDLRNHPVFRLEREHVSGA
jgi:deazaflavin-dependent oxidoreductase (nitroreductase family)